MQGTAEVAFDELAPEMQRARVSGLNAALRKHDLVYAGEHRHHDQQDNDAGGDCRPTMLEALASAFVLIGQGAVAHGAPARGTNTSR